VTGKVERDELLKMLQVMRHPKANGLTQEALSQILVDFCAECPDPVGARWLIVECLDPMSDDELVDRALDMPFRSII
jgi:hypothetical protein